LPTHFILLDSLNLIIFPEKYKLLSSQVRNLFQPPVTAYQILSSRPLFRKPSICVLSCISISF
jgi:hypothetical protein